jgi:hypothetical protein
MKRLGIFHTVLFAEFPVARQHKLPDVIAVGRRIVVAQEGQSLVFSEKGATLDSAATGSMNRTRQCNGVVSKRNYVVFPDLGMASLLVGYR